MGHLGLTPQSVHQFGGFKVQGRDEEAADQLVADAVALAEAGAFSGRAGVRARGARAPRDRGVDVPTIGIGAGPDDRRAGARLARPPRADDRTAATLRQGLRRPAGGDLGAVKSFQSEVADGEYPGPEHTY
jgi:3-methyl-2-oxobutanoate hydroxymethyltransferase